MARRGSMNTVGRAKFELKKLSVATASSAVSLRRFNTSSSSSTRRPLDPNVRRNTQIEQRLCRKPASPARLDRECAYRPAAATTCVDAAHGLPLKYCRLAAIDEPGSRHINRAHYAEDVGPIVRQPTFCIRQIIRIASERVVRGNRAELRAIGGGPAGRLQPGSP